MKNAALHIFLGVLFCLLPIFGWGQNSEDQGSTDINDTTEVKNLMIEKANSQVIEIQGDSTIQMANGDVVLYYDSTYLYADSVLIIDQFAKVWGNVSIVKGDSLKLFSDTLKIYNDSAMAYFIGSVVLEQGESSLYTTFLQYDLDAEMAIYSDTALLVSPESKLKSKRGIYHTKYKYVNFYQNVSIEGTDFYLLSDSLRYYTELKKALFLSPTVITKDSAKIYSESGFYDIDDDVGSFDGRAQYVTSETVSTADTIKYFGKEERYNLLGNARYISGEDAGTADTIRYNKQTGDIFLVGNANFKNPDNDVSGSRIYYNEKTEEIKVTGNSFLSSPPRLIRAENISYDKANGNAVLERNVVVEDSTNNSILESDFAFFNEEANTMKAFREEGKPLLTMVEEADTTYLSGDTLSSFELATVIDSLGTTDTTKYYVADNNVEILTADMQARSDSLVFNETDSVFVLFGNPVMWSDSSQFTAEKMTIEMKGGKLSKVTLEGQSLIIDAEEYNLFNQISGLGIDIFFEDGEIYQMKVKRDASSIYYLKDEVKAYLGVDQTTCNRMTFNFDDGDLVETKYFGTPTSQILPMKTTDHNSLRLEGFDWTYSNRPTTLEDLYF